MFIFRWRKALRVQRPSGSSYADLDNCPIWWFLIWETTFCDVLKVTLCTVFSLSNMFWLYPSWLANRGSSPVQQSIPASEAWQITHHTSKSELFTYFFHPPAEHGRPTAASGSCCMCFAQRHCCTVCLGNQASFWKRSSDQSFKMHGNHTANPTFMFVCPSRMLHCRLSS